MTKKRTHVRIPVPQKIPAGRGIDAARSLHWPFPTRFSVDDIRLIEQEAKRLGLSKGNFIRWCAVLVAKELASDYGDGGDALTRKRSDTKSG